MSTLLFDPTFETLTGHPPFPWQQELYARFLKGDFPASCNLPTGLGKTNVIAVWLLALAQAPDRVPRRLVYVVNRRTVVDQSSRVTEQIRDNLAKVPALARRLTALAALPADTPLAISTLRGQFADNREWRGDPARPAVIVGTVDMIGSRLLFSGYGCGFKSRPLHAGFLAQDVLLVHDEAHLEPAFQTLLTDLRAEQQRCQEFRRFHVLELTATRRPGQQTAPFELTSQDRQHKVVKQRLAAKKHLALHAAEEKQVVPTLARLALQHRDSGQAILVFVRTVEGVADVRKALLAAKMPEQDISLLTGTMRGLERDRMASRDPVFRRFLPDAESDGRTVYLLCTAAGEVGVDISADHLVCDLTPFDSMAQRFGRVNRYGHGNARIDVVHEPAFAADDDPYQQARALTLELLRELGDDASPAALCCLDADRRQAAFTPAPAVVPTSDILFDAWAATTVRDRLPGRPPVADFLHGVAEWQPPETYVAWREEVALLQGEHFSDEDREDILENYPLKPHELLRDRTDRVFKHLQQLAEHHPAAPVWLVATDGSIRSVSLAELVEEGKDILADMTVILPPAVGGLNAAGMLGPGEAVLMLDVADEWFEDDAHTVRRRYRTWDDEDVPAGMRLVQVLDTRSDADEEEPDEEGPAPARYRRWFVRPRSADDDGSRTLTRNAEQLLDDHNTRAGEAARGIVTALRLPASLADAVVLAAAHHDDGKHRALWQASIGNRDPKKWLAKSGHKLPPKELTGYRHEFGSLLDIGQLPEFQALPEDSRDLVLHLVAAHHGRARPHFPSHEAFDPDRAQQEADAAAREVPLRFARLQRRYGRWGLAWLESLVRAADILASQPPEETP